MIAKWKIKDFQIKSYWTGTRLKSSAEYAYKIIWNGKEIKDGFTRKIDALNYIRKLVKIQNYGVENLL